MKKNIFVSVITRYEKKAEDSGAIYCFNWETKKLFQTIPFYEGSFYPERNVDHKGYRGLAFFEDKLYAATDNSILIFDFYKDKFKLIDIILYDSFSDIHEIRIYKKDLFIVNTGSDSLLKYSLEDKTISTVFQDFDLARPDKYHFNSVQILCNYDILLLSAFDANIINIFNKKSYFIPDMDMPHNIERFTDSSFLINNTNKKRIEKFNNDFKKISDFYIEDEKFLIPDTNKMKSGFLRGLCITDDEIIVGSTPAHILVLDYSGKLKERLRISEELRHSPFSIIKNWSN